MAKQSTTNRRNFIANSVKGGLALSIGMSSAAPLLQSCSAAKYLVKSNLKTGFDQQPLPKHFVVIMSAAVVTHFG